MYFCSRLSETPNMAVVAQLVRVPDCGSVGRRFESDLPPESKAATRDCRCFAFIVLRQANRNINSISDFLSAEKPQIHGNKIVVWGV